MDYKPLASDEDPAANAPVAAPVVVQQQPTAVTTVSVLQCTNPIFGPDPVLAFCHNCSHTGFTVTDSEPGSTAWLLGCLLCFLG